MYFPMLILLDIQLHLWRLHPLYQRGLPVCCHHNPLCLLDYLGNKQTYCTLKRPRKYLIVNPHWSTDRSQDRNNGWIHSRNPSPYRSSNRDRGRGCFRRGCNAATTDCCQASSDSAYCPTHRRCRQIAATAPMDEPPKTARLWGTKGEEDTHSSTSLSFGRSRGEISLIR